VAEGYIVAEKTSTFGMKGKIILSLGGIVLLSMLILGISIYRESIQAAENAAVKTSASSIDGISIEIEETLAADRRTLLSLRGTPPVEAIIRSRDAGGIDPVSGDRIALWHRRLEKIFEAFMANHPQYLQLSYIDEKGNEIVRVQSGNRIPYRVSRGNLQNKSDQTYVVKTLKLPPGHFYTSDVALNREHGNIQVPHIPTFLIATPVYHAGKVRGIIIINFTTEKLFAGIVDHASGIETYLTDQNGYFLIHSDMSKAFGFDLGTDFQLGHDKQDLMRLSRNHDSFTRFHRLHREVDGFRKIYFDPEDHSHYWLLSYHIPASEVFAEVNSLRNTMLTSGLIITLISLLIIVWFVSRKLVNPITLLAQTTGKMQAGDLSVRADTRLVKDELRTLYQAINAFAEKQKKTTAYLEKQVAERTEYLSCIVDNLVDGLITIDEKGIIHSFNSAAEKIFGYNADEIIGENVKTLMPEPFRAEHDGYLHNYISTEKKKIIGIGRQVEGLRKDGEAFPLDLAVSEIYTDGKRQFIGTVRDITERVLAEQNIADKNRELEQNNRMKSEFLANMSHELRTPLNAIIGFSEVLKDGMTGQMSEQQTDYIGEIFNSGQHLLSLINDILDLSKIESGKMELDLEQTNIPDLLHNSLSIIKEKAMKHRIKISQEIGDGIENCWIDRRKIKQIVFNLLSNAVKFTPDGGSVYLRVHKITNKKMDASSNENFLEISVSDTGIGISDADQKKLFSAFVQADSSLARKYEGTGLGLVIIKKLAELHGGTVDMRSEQGKGSTFTVWLPYRTDGEKDESVITTASDNPRHNRNRVQAIHPSASPFTDSLSVLIIEDENTAADLMRVQLETAGYRTLHAASADAALEILSETKPDLITLDILMPGTDGWDFLAMLKNDKALAHIPVVIVSIIANEKKGFSLGAAEILQKPVGKKALLTAIRDAGSGSITAIASSTILVVDDDPKAVAIVSRHLESTGATVLRAYGGAEAIELAIEKYPDLIVLDLMMPEVTGFDVVDALKTSQETAQIPIIILTAKVITDKDRKALNGGILKIVKKSNFDHGAFINEVWRATGKERIKPV